VPGGLVILPPRLDTFAHFDSVVFPINPARKHSTTGGGSIECSFSTRLKSGANIISLFHHNIILTHRTHYSFRRFPFPVLRFPSLRLSVSPSLRLSVSPFSRSPFSVFRLSVSPFSVFPCHMYRGVWILSSCSDFVEMNSDIIK
jgi:hypothetical protein